MAVFVHALTEQVCDGWNQKKCVCEEEEPPGVSRRVEKRAEEAQEVSSTIEWRRRRLEGTYEFSSGAGRGAQTTVLMPLCLDLVLLVVWEGAAGGA